MGNETPKQFLELLGKPILLHTLEKFDGIADEIILVLPASHISYWQTLLSKFPDAPAHRIAEGGETRTASVLNGLSAITGEGVVAIHDAVRPLVSRELIIRTFDTATRQGSAVPLTEVRDSLREKDGTGSVPVDRSRFLAVQTPQCFRSKLLKEAYARAGNDVYTDDATVFGMAGYDITPVQGEHSNIKITYPEDLIFASAVLGG